MSKDKENIHNVIDFIFLFVTFIIFIFGSIKMYEGYTLPLSIVSSLSYLGLRLTQKMGVKFPKSTLFIILSAIISFIHYKIFGGKIYFSLVFLSGGLYWIIFHNIKETMNKIFVPSLVVFSLVMSIIYTILLLSGITTMESNNLVLPLYKGMMHNHLGDLWAVTLVGVIFSTTQERKIWNIPVIVLGLTFVAISFSRSAVVSLVVGSGFILYKIKGNNQKYANLFISLLVVSFVLFVFFGVFKTTLFSRPYTHEAISSIISRPFGVGLGNFSKVSTESSLAHNLILEIVTGMGIFSVAFLFWLIAMFQRIFKAGVSLLYSSFFLAIFTNFFFDTTYDIPTMIWIWIIATALMFATTLEK